MALPTPSPPHSRSDFHVAIICALHFEADAILQNLDIRWNDSDHYYGAELGDPNSYTTGVIGQHHVVLVHMPQAGLVSAAISANSLMRSFPEIRLTLLVGVCGGVPSGPHHSKDIFLGDLVIGTGIVNYDFGRQYPATFEPKDGHGQLDHRIRSALAKMSTATLSQKLRVMLSTSLSQLYTEETDTRCLVPKKDHLYKPNYLHRHRSDNSTENCLQCSAATGITCSTAKHASCEELQCDLTETIERTRITPRKGTTEDSVHRPEVHFGKIGSGNAVMKSGHHRDMLSQRDGIIAFEMEGSGIWEQCPCVIVKGVSDYADSHKSKSWQRYAAMVAAIGARHLLLEWDPKHALFVGTRTNSSSKSKNTAKQGRWLLPFTRDQHYIQRGNVIHQLDELFLSGDRSARVVLSGLGGIGKSQIAIEYAYHVHEQSPETSVFWVHASNEFRFRASLQAIARELQLPGFQDSKTDHMELVYHWFLGSESGSWLLILDNVDDIEIVKSASEQDQPKFSLTRYLPQRMNGAILVTSRNSQVASALASSPMHILRITEMSQPEALLLASSRIPDYLGEESDRVQLCEALENLPLAITQAAAYISRSHMMTVKRYVELLTGREHDTVRLLAEPIADLRRDAQIPHSIMATWSISVEQMRSQSQMAVDLLALMSVLDRQAIPKYLIQAEIGDFEFDYAIETLISYAFISIEHGSEMCFSTHRLVQIATRSWLRKDDSYLLWHEKALALLAQTYPDSDYGNWAECQMLEPHVARVAQTSCQSDRSCLDMARIMERRSSYHSDRDNLDLAEQCAQFSVDERTRLLGIEHPDTLDSMNALAVVLSRRGHYDAAQRTLRTILTLSDQIGNTRTERRVTYLSNLANTLISSGNPVLAITTCREAIAVHESAHASNQTVRLQVRGRLVHALHEARQFTEAEQECRDILQIQNKLLGWEHPDTLYTVCSLVRILTRRGYYDEAEELARWNLTSRRKILGRDHRKTYYSMDDLARVLTFQGNYDEAERLIRACIAGLERILGIDHPQMFDKTLCLIRILIRQGAHEEAQSLYQRTVE